MRPHPVCDAGAEGLKCRHLAYVFQGSMWLCVDHWQFYRDVFYDVDALYQVTLFDWEQDT